MRWLFTMLIALFYCASSADGQKISAVKTRTVAVVLIDQAFKDEKIVSSKTYINLPTNEFRRKPPKTLLLLSSYRSFLLSTFQLLPSYTLALDFGYRYLSQQQLNVPTYEQPQQVNWMLHSSQQQNRLGGWKESNILYRGSLTYHS